MENKIVKTFFVLLVIDIISSTMMKKDGSKVVKPDQDQDCIHFLKTYFPQSLIPLHKKGTRILLKRIQTMNNSIIRNPPQIKLRQLYNIVLDDPTKEHLIKQGNIFIKGMDLRYKSTAKSILQHVSIYPSQQYKTAQKALIAKLLSYVQYAALAVIMFGDYIFSYLQSPYPQWYLKIRENKFMYGMGVWFLGNMIVGNLTQSGAFEILANNRIIFSKLQTGQMPNMDIIFNAVEKLVR